MSSADGSDATDMILFQCGWYWGPISGEAAEKVLANEPDGSFIVRDSSDHHYIFSLTFKLNGFIRHVRIEHDQGKISQLFINISFSHSVKSGFYCERCRTLLVLICNVKFFILSFFLFVPQINSEVYFTNSHMHTNKGKI